MGWRRQHPELSRRPLQRPSQPESVQGRLRLRPGRPNHLEAIRRHLGLGDEEQIRRPPVARERPRFPRLSAAPTPPGWSRPVSPTVLRWYLVHWLSSSARYTSTG